MSLLERIKEFKSICNISGESESRPYSPPKKANNLAKSQHRIHQEETTDWQETTETPMPQMPSQSIMVIDQPRLMSGGKLKEYQLEGLQWLLQIHSYSELYKARYPSNDCNKYQINSILADEMGLGKTMQCLSLFAALKENYNIDGRHLIVVPKSTIPQWQAEIQKWCPFIKMLCIIGEQSEREQQVEVMKDSMFTVILTTYDVINIEIRHFLKYKFCYLVLDEGHKLKSQETIICNHIKQLKTQHKLLMTGTPIQNDLNELWSLLNVLMPFLFDNPEEFVQVLQQEQNVQQLQEILQIFILRREKKDVEKLPPKYEYLIKCPMTQLQKRLYKGILMRDANALREAVGSKSAEAGRNSLVNILMQLRKCADHPYLFNGVEPEPFVDGDHIVNVSGKMVVLAKLLEKILDRKEKMLIFCQMTSLLDIIEDYLCYKKIGYVRIDGSTELEDRSQNMKKFMQNNQDASVFLLSTRAGCLGLNLTAANHVVIFQQDFNPQVDLQAVARAYRILQKRNVFVYRLLSENSVDIRIYERSCVKIKLDELIMQNGNYTGQQVQKIEKKQHKNQMMDMVSFGAEQLFNDLEQDKGEKWDYNTPEIAFSGEKLEQLLGAAFEEQKKIDNQVVEQQKRAEEVIRKLAADGHLDTEDVAGLYQFEGQNFQDFKAISERINEENRKKFEYKYEYKEESEDERDRRDYLNQAKFKRSPFYRAEFYLLPEKFYKLQEKILAEVTQIESIFKLNASMTWESYLKDVQNGPRAPLYVNPEAPGLNEKQLIEYQRYLQQYCPILNCVITKKDFQAICSSLTDFNIEENPVEAGLKRIIFETEFEKYAHITDFTNDPKLQVKYSFGLLPPSSRYKIAPMRDISSLGDPDYALSYRVFKEQSPLQISEEQFTQYCKLILQQLPDYEGVQKVLRAIERRKQTLKKYTIVQQMVQSSDCPLLKMNAAFPSSKAKSFQENQDRFLIVWTSIFGYYQYDHCLQFVKACPQFRLAYWFRSRAPGDYKERVEKLVKYQGRGGVEGVEQ